MDCLSGKWPGKSYPIYYTVEVVSQVVLTQELGKKWGLKDLQQGWTLLWMLGFVIKLDTH